MMLDSGKVVKCMMEPVCVTVMKVKKAFLMALQNLVEMLIMLLEILLVKLVNF